MNPNLQFDFLVNKHADTKSVKDRYNGSFCRREHTAQNSKEDKSSQQNGPNSFLKSCPNLLYWLKFSLGIASFYS